MRRLFSGDNDTSHSVSIEGLIKGRIKALEWPVEIKEAVLSILLMCVYDINDTFILLRSN